MKRFVPYFRLFGPVKWAFVSALFCGLLYGASSGGGLPFVTKEIVGTVLGGFELSNSEVIGTVLMIPLIFAIRGIGGFFNAYLIGVCGVKILEQIRVQLFDKLQTLHLQFYSDHKSGDLLSRLINDTEQLKQTIIKISNDVLVQPFTLIFAVGYLVYQGIENRNVAFLLVFIAVVPLCVLPIRHFGKRLYLRAKQMQKEMAGVFEFARECLSAPKEVRAYNLQRRQASRFAEIIRSFFNIQLKVIRYTKGLSPIIEFITACCTAVAIYYAARAGVSSDQMIGVLVALYFAYEPVKKLGSVHTELRRGAASLDRLEEILNAPVVVADPTDGRRPETVEGRIQFDGVEFSYGDLPTLTEVTCTIEPGEVVALVGPSGAGKSTFANLLPRFYDVRSGAIRLDGLELPKLSLSWLRDQVALVPQDPVLFNDTIGENIRLGRLDATQHEVEAAATRAHADLFIQECEDGYETIVGEKGMRLSGGQKQRIAIARAFLKNAPILILDEATSALDSETERVIQDALRELIQGKTVIMIAHRFSTIQLADRIFVFDAGRIVAQGAHDEVYQASPIYRRLYDQQMT